METKKNEQISVDNTFRFMHTTFRNTGFSLVAIEFKYGGRTWRADTIDEALELKSRLEQEDKVTIMSGGEPSDAEQFSWAPDVFTDLLQNLGDHQKAFLRVLYQQQGWVPSDKIVKELSLNSEVSFAGVLSGLSKQSKKLDIMPWQLYEVQVTWKVKSKTRFFRLSSGFRWAADELGWPDNWI